MLWKQQRWRSHGLWPLRSFYIVVSSPSFFHSFLPFDVVAPEIKVQWYVSSGDSALPSPRTPTLFSPENHCLMKEWNIRSPLPLPPRHQPSRPPPRWRLSPGLGVHLCPSSCGRESGPPLPWQMAADLNKEIGCSFQCPVEACPLHLFFLFAWRTAGSVGLKASVFICLGFLSLHF